MAIVPDVKSTASAILGNQSKLTWIELDGTKLSFHDSIKARFRAGFFITTGYAVSSSTLTKGENLRRSTSELFTTRRGQV